MKNIVMFSIVFCVAQNNAAGDAEKAPLIGVACKPGMFALKRDIIETNCGKEYVCAVARTFENTFSQEEVQKVADEVFLAYTKSSSYQSEAETLRAITQKKFLYYIFYLYEGKRAENLWEKSSGRSTCHHLSIFDTKHNSKITRETVGGFFREATSRIEKGDGKSVDQLAQDALAELTGEDGIVTVIDAASWVRR